MRREDLTQGSLGLYYAASWLWRRHVPLLPVLLDLALFVLTGARVTHETQIGKRCRLAHGGNGVVIHRKARVGNRVWIGQQVTLGGAGQQGKYPVVEDDVYLGAGCKVLGGVVVGHNSVIGANAVVTCSVPPRSVVGGVPARILREDVDGHTVESW